MTPSESPESYEILDTLGSGGWAEVYVARSRMLSDHLVALKLLRPEVEQRAHAVRRFHRELEVGFHLNHPNIASARAETEVRGRAALVLELVGPSIDSMREHIVGNFPVIRWIARHALRALAELERQGVAHRDLSLGNLLIDPRGDIRIIDFGVATRYDGSATPGPVSATWPYISPELLCGERGTPGSDMFSLGGILYELATGDVPFGKDRQTVEQGHVRSALTLPHFVPRDLRRVILGMLVLDPTARLCPAEALAMLARDDPSIADYLGLLCRRWFRRQCPGLTHPLEHAGSCASAAVPPWERGASWSWRTITPMLAGVTAIACAGVWHVLATVPKEHHQIAESAENAPRPVRAYVQLGDISLAPSDNVQLSAPTLGVDEDAAATQGKMLLPDARAVLSRAREGAKREQRGQRRDGAQVVRKTATEMLRDNLDAIVQVEHAQIEAYSGRLVNGVVRIPLVVRGLFEIGSIAVRHSRGTIEARWEDGALVFESGEWLRQETVTILLTAQDGESNALIPGVTVR